MRLRLLVTRLLALARGRRLDRELEEEMLAHLELAERDARAAGMSAEEARRVARLRFGGVARLREEHRDRRSVRWIELLVRDIRYGLASLRRQPAFTTITVSVLALGIGGTAAMFSLVDGVLLKPLPFPQPDRIVRVWDAPRPGIVNSTSVPDFLEWQRLGTAFDALAAERPVSPTLLGRGDALRLTGKAVTPDYFTVFATPAHLGRVFVPGDDARVVVLGDAAWQRLFGGDPAIVGQHVILDGEPHQVVGVLPPGAFDRDEMAVWLPLVFTPEQRQARHHWLTVHGRLRAGTSLTQAREQMQAVHAALMANAPVDERASTLEIEPLDRLLVGDGLRRSIIVAFGAAVLVLLIACANVANLSLARGTSRRKELAVRAALGAGRGRLVAQLLTESLVLCALGGLAGLAMASALMQAAAPILSKSIPFTADVRLDVRAFAFTACLVVAVALLVGILPALQTRFENLAHSLNLSTRGSSGAQGRIRRAIVIGEVALSLVLLCGAGLLARSVLNLQRLDTGARVEQVVTLALDLPMFDYPTPESAANFYTTVVERLRVVPGVSRAALSTDLPLRWIGNGESVRVAGVEQPLNVRFKRVDPGYFETLDIPLRAGRGITDRDRQGTTPVIVINEALASRLAEAGGLREPIGKAVRLSSPAYMPRQGSELTVEIVGIIRSERVGDPRLPDPPVAYVPLAQVPGASLKLIVRTERETAAVIPGIREALREVAPNVPLGQIASMTDVREETFAGTTRPAWIIAIFAAMATLLAALGLYGVLAHLVSQRRREIGIRMALGARASDIVFEIATDALSLILVGLGLGLLAAFGLTRVLASLLYEVSPLDPVALVAACAAMVGVGLLAAFLPAGRAARVDPVGVLRDEG